MDKSDNFRKLGIDRHFEKALNELKIEHPTPIQKEAIPLLLSTEIDLVAQAQTGTGKTAAYGLPILQHIDSSKQQVQALILCPTRELSQQVAKQLFKFTKYANRIFAEAVYGGQPMEKQISALKRPTHIIVATPGRLIDLVQRKAVDLKYVNTVVLDEADEMLSMGFKKELDQILEFLSEVKQRWLFSATMPDGIKQIIHKYMDENAYRINVAKQNTVNENITHQYVMCAENQKTEIVLSFLRTHHGEQGIVFCRTKSSVKQLSEQLFAKKQSVGAIHGDLYQKERDKVMRAFRNKKINLLLSTDIAARGIDIADLSFVIHYELPDKDEFYTHRSGRTARGGKKGTSLALVTTGNFDQLKRIEKKLQIRIEKI